MYKKTLTLMTCIKIRRATDIISHSLPERRSIFNAIGQSSPMFISVHSPAVEMDQAIWFRLCSGPPKGGVRDYRDCGTISCHFSHYFLQNTSGLGVLACSVVTKLHYKITMFFICTGTNKS